MDEKSLFEKLSENTKIPFHMPGHKRNTENFAILEKLGSKYDITEIDGFDNLHNAEGILKNSMDLAKKIWGSKKSYYLVNGSSSGILAAVYSCVKFGGRVICARNCHKSVYNALKLTGADVYFVNPSYDEKTGICGEILPDDIIEAIKNLNGADLIILTSPTYEGVVSNVEKICEIAHKNNIPVLVDEAHGSHFSFGFFPKNALTLGADIVVQSLHKTLASLTQTAILHVSSDRINLTKLEENLAIFQTSSPSYIFLASIDSLVRNLYKNSGSIFSDWEKRLDAFYDSIKSLKNLEILTENYNLGYAFDKSKIVILTHKTNISGAKLMDILRKEYNIECEMCSAKYVVAMTGMGDTDENLQKLSDALIHIDSLLTARKCEKLLLYPKNFKKVFCALEAENKDFCEIDIKNAKGKICAEYVFAYPPGIPIIIPGEEITDEILEIIEIYKSNGTRLIGSKNGNFKKIHIIR